MTAPSEAIPGTFITIALSDVRPNSVALRQVDKDSVKFREIVDSIPKVGILQPPNVVPRSIQARDDEGTPMVDEAGHPIIEEFFELCDGLHRYSAALEAGLEETIFHVLDPAMSATDVLATQVIANLARVETKPIEYSKQISRILQHNPTWTISELASKLAVSPSFIEARLSLGKITNEEIKNRVDAGDINLTNAAALAALPEAEQLDYLQQAMTEPAAAFKGIVKNRLKAIKDGQAKGKGASDEFAGVRPRLRKVVELTEAIADPSGVMAFVEGMTDPTAIVLETLKWAASMDAKSEEIARANHEASVAKRKEAARKRDMDKEARKAAKAQERAAAAQKAAEEAQKQFAAQSVAETQEG